MAAGSLLAKLIREGISEPAAKRTVERAAAQQRAVDQGFDTSRVLYHGSPEEKITEFKVGPHDETAIDSLSLSDDPAVAADYALGGYGRHGFNLRDPESDFLSRLGEEGVSPTVYPTYVRGKTPEFGEAVEIYEKKHGENSFLDASSEDFTRSMSEEGITGVQIFDDEVAMLDTTAIRSVNAKFDPAKRDSANLLASATGAGVLGAAALAPQEAEARLISSLQASRESEIKAPKNPRTAQLASAMRAGARAVKGSPAELLYPSGLAPWLERIAYDEKPSTMETVTAISDFL